MEYLTGYTIKPYITESDGEVLFTDGTNNEIRANQVQCEAYGYTYDAANGVCRSFQYNSRLNRDIDNLGNKLNGAGNTTGLGANTVQVNGTNNVIQGFNNNCFVNGNLNEIINGVDNATVFGRLAEAQATNSIVLGGNAVADSVGERQNITLMFGRETTDNSVVDSYFNNTVGSYFEVPLNTAITFQTETVGVRIGGTGGGALGDFKAMIEVGAVVCDKGGGLTLDKSRTVIANSGTTSGWISDVVVSGQNLVQQVKGANNRTIMWATTIRMTQIKTGIDL